MKTCEYNKEIKIFLFANLIGEDINISDIENAIKETPYEEWNIDNFNSLKMKDNQLIDLFVFETYNSLVFNVNEIF